MRRRLHKAAAVGAASASAAALVVAGGGASAIAGFAHVPAAAGTAITRGLDVLPFPGTPDAAPASKIMFPAVAPSAIAAITVHGSRSGRHPGRLGAQPYGNGSAFSPDRPFAPGERVEVTAMLRSRVAGAASGAQGAKRVSFSFSIASSAGRWGTGVQARPDLTILRASPRGRHVTQTFVSAPHLHPPTIRMRGRVRDPRAGDIFLDAQKTGHPGAYFLNPEGQLLWFESSTADGEGGPSVFNVRVQRDGHQPVLTYWQGLVVPPGVGEGKDLILNERYRVIHTITAGDGYQRRGTDLHEFTLGHRGSEPTAYVTIAAPTRANLTSIGGPAHGMVLDWIIQEIDIATNRVIWEWHALGHVPLTASHEPYVPGQPYDFFHVNSIQQLRSGNLIVSARHTWAVYEIDKKSGRFVWELGGKHSSFRMGPGAKFLWQHDATLHSDGLVTLFDDNAASAFGQSRSLELRIDIARHRATLVRSYTHKPRPVLALSQGSVQLLPDHDVFVGWGSGRYFSEFAPDGRQLFDGVFPPGVQSYRAYRFSDWVGKPQQAPGLALRKSSRPGQDNLYVSWNGATRVRRWRVLASANKAGPFLKAGPSAKWSGFETRISISISAGPYFEVQALGAGGAVLRRGTSVPRRAPGT